MGRAPSTTRSDVKVPFLSSAGFAPGFVGGQDGGGGEDDDGGDGAVEDLLGGVGEQAGPGGVDGVDQGGVAGQHRDDEHGDVQHELDRDPPVAHQAPVAAQAEDD